MESIVETRWCFGFNGMTGKVNISSKVIVIRWRVLDGETRRQ